MTDDSLNIVEWLRHPYCIGTDDDDVKRHIRFFDVKLHIWFFLNKFNKNVGCHWSMWTHLLQEEDNDWFLYIPLCVCLYLIISRKSLFIMKLVLVQIWIWRLIFLSHWSILERNRYITLRTFNWHRSRKYNNRQDDKYRAVHVLD